MYELSGDFRGAVINIKSTIVGAAEVKDIEDQPPEPGEPPFKGLQYFDEQDAGRFFGREQLTAKIVGRLAEMRFLAIVGASGSGKSSLVRAGVIPALRRGERLADGALPPTDSGQWAMHLITPTAHPLEALAATLMRDAPSVSAVAALQQELAANPRALALAARQALAQGGHTHLLLVIDQFEEIFTLCRSAAERQAFIDNLLAAADPQDAQPITLLIALRADFYAHCAQHDGLREIVSRQQEYIGAMSREELFRAIVQPAALGGWKIQEGLVELMLDEVQDEPGALPLLSHALLETWARRRGRTMTLSGYTESGGIRGAIAQTAETVFRQRLTPPQQAVARMIFVRLTELGEAGQEGGPASPDTRRRVPFSELITRASDELTIEAVLNILAEARLVTTDTLPPGDTQVVEVAHEAIIREWPTLRGWLNQDREGLIRQRQLTQDASDWEQLNRDAGALYRGARLEQTLAWLKGYTEPLSLLESDFLEASRANAVQEAAQAQKLARAARLQRALAAISVGLVLVVAYVAATGGRLFEPAREPARMDGVFNIAVAEFGQAGPDGRVSKASGEAGGLLSKWTFDNLQAEFKADPNILVWNDSPALLEEKNVRIGVAGDGEPQSQVESPAALAERLNANMVVYGVITPTSNGFAELTLKFYIAPRLDYDYAEIGGRYQLGQPIPFGLADPGLEVQQQLGRQSSALAHLTLGLNYELLNQSHPALDAFLKAASFMEDSEVLQFLIGREYLFLAQKETAGRAQNEAAAEQAFKEALRLNDRYARAYIGLGGVYFQQAQRTLAETYADDYPGDRDAAYRSTLALIEPAIANYARVLEQHSDPRDYGMPIDSVARLALGVSYRVKGEAHYRLGDSQAAGEYIQRAVDTLEAAVQPLTDAGEHRFLAQVFKGLGSAYEWKAFLAGEDKALYQQAIAYYDKCIEQGALFPVDTFLRDEVVAKLCVPYRDRLNQAYGAEQ